MRKKDQEMYKKILGEIRKDNMVTEVFIANKYLITERTVRRYIKDLKDNKVIEMVGHARKKYWKIIDVVNNFK